WRSRSPRAEPAPAIDRALLETVGVVIGVASAPSFGAIALGLACIDGCGYEGLFATGLAAAISTLLTVPLGVYAMGMASGRRGDVLWTLLGSVVGALLGGALLAGGSILDEIGDGSAAL